MEEIKNNEMFGLNLNKNLPEAPEEDKKPFWKNYTFWMIVISLLLVLFILLKTANALDKQQLCNAANLTSINDCDEYWNLLHNNTQTIINQIQNNTIVINNITYFNTTLPEDVDIIKERNRHDEELARIGKGIVQQGNSSTIILGDFVRKDELSTLIIPALTPYLSTSDFGNKFEQFYALKQINLTDISQETKSNLEFYQTPGFIAIAFLLIFIGGFFINKYFKKRKSYGLSSRDQIEIEQQEEPPKKIIKVVMPPKSEEVKPESGE